MKNKTTVFEEALLNARGASEIGRAGRAPVGTFEVNAVRIKELRRWTRLSQAEFAAVLGVALSTLRNWEQGRREPTGAARALLRAICNDPEHVITALAPPGQVHGSASAALAARGAAPRRRARRTEAA
jgi:putative transcriptional regulator